MTAEETKRKIRNDILLATRRETGQGFLPAAVSGRHIHLTREVVETLFGSGYQLTRKSDLSQPGQFASEETLTVEGPRGKLNRVRVLGPEREEVQMELSVTDAHSIGVSPVVRMSGDVAGTPGIRIVGAVGSAEITQGVIVAARHLHISTEQAAVYGLRDGELIRLKTDGPRPVVFEDIQVRVGDKFDMEVHIDFDEANAAMIKNGDLLEII